MALPVQASVWVGQVRDRQTLEAALDVDATACDGDALGSAFSRAAGDGALASCPREVKVLPRSTQSIAELLEGISFSEQLRAQSPATAGRECNAAVVFYGRRSSGGLVRLAGVELELVAESPRTAIGEQP
jgi:hypothetical protein